MSKSFSIKKIVIVNLFNFDKISYRKFDLKLNKYRNLKIK